MGRDLKFVVIDSEENSRNIIKNYLAEIDTKFAEPECFVEFFDFESGTDYVLKTPECIVFIDISESPKNSLDTIKKIKESSKSAIIIALSGKTSTDIIIKAMRAGAREFISKPIIKTEFINTISALLEDIKDSSSKDNSCKIISTFSNKGGIGKTSIAVNLAVELAQLSKENVALIDLNLQLGDVTTFLDLAPSFSLNYIAENIDNLDETELLKILPKYKNTSLHVIADPLNIEESTDITAEKLKKLLNTLKKSFSYIVIDIGTNVDTKNRCALDMSDLILLVSVVNLPAIRSTQRCMEMFEKIGYPKDKVKLVLNRYLDNDDIKISDIEEAVNQKVYWKIPNNYLTMMSAINKGVPVNEINTESNISQNYMEFATKVSDYLITKNLNKNYNL